MNELNELESGIDRLKRDSQTKRMLINALEKEKQELLRRSDEISERLSQSNASYKESARKIMDYVNAQNSGFKTEIAGLSNSIKGLSTLEQRLESQEAGHAKMLSRIEKELLLVSKSLSDVERVKTELANQKTFFQEAKLQMEKGLQSGVAYLRKEMDMNRKEDAKRALNEFKEELERITSIEKELNAYKRSQDSRLDTLVQDQSSIKSALGDLRLLKERSSSLEGFAQNLGSKVDDLSNRQKVAAASITDDISRRLERSLTQFRKDVESQREEDNTTHIRELKNELQRVAGLEQGFQASTKRLDQLGRELSALQSTPDQINLLREKLEEGIHMNQSLAEKTVSAKDFERTARTVSKRMEEIEDKVFSVDKRLSNDKNRIEKAILEVLNEEKVLEGTQENIKQWFDARFQDLEKKASSGIDALTTQMEEGSALVDRLRQKSQKMDLMTREVPKKIEEHSRIITRLIDSKTGLAASLENLSGGLNTVSQGLSGSLERISSLEKGLSTSDKGKDSRLSRLGADLSAYQQELKNQGMLLKDLSESSRLDMANLRNELAASLKTSDNDLEARVKEATEQGLMELRERTRGLASVKDVSSELKVLRQGLSVVEASGKQFSERIEKDLTATKNMIESQLSELNDDQAKQFRKEFDYISKNVDSIRNLSSDVKIFRTKLQDLERSSRELVSLNDFNTFRKAVDARLTEVGEYAKGINGSLSGDLEKMASGLESSKLSAKEFEAFRKTIEGRLAEIGEYSKNVDGSITNDLEKMATGLEASKLSAKEFEAFRKAIESRLTQVDSGSRQSVDALSKDLEKLSTVLGSSKLSSSDFSKAMELMETRLQDLGVMSKTSNDELWKDLNAFKKQVSNRFNESSTSHIRELKEELGRLAQLEKEVDANSRTGEKRLDQLSEGLVSLQAMPSEIGILREKIDSIEELSGSAVYGREYSQRMGEINNTLDQLQSGLTGLEKRVNKQSSGLEAALGEAMSEGKLMEKSQQAMTKLIDARIIELDKKLASSFQDLAKGFAGNSGIMSTLREDLLHLKGLPKQAAEQAAVVSSLKDRLVRLETRTSSVAGKASDIDGILKRLAKLESLSQKVLDNSDLLEGLGDENRNLGVLVTTLPKTVEKHSEAISRIFESKDLLSDTVASLKAELAGVTDKLSTSHERLVTLEKGFASNGKSKESRLDQLSKTVESMETRLEANRNETKEFREYAINHVNDIVNSYEKRFGELSTSLESMHSGDKQKSLSDLVHLRDKVAELDGVTKDLSKNAVDEDEFVQTIKAVSKRIDGMEDLFSKSNLKISAKGESLDAAVSRALSKENLLEMSQKSLQDMLESRIAGLEKGITAEMRTKLENLGTQVRDLSGGTKEIAAIREDLARLKTVEQHLDSNVMSKVSESLVNFTKLNEKSESRLEALASELKSMNDRLIEESGKSNQLEMKLKTAMDSQKVSVKEALRKEREIVDNEINDETAKILKDAEVGELKRKQEFDNLLRKFQDLHVKTQSNLDAVAQQRENFLNLENNLRERVDKQNKALETKVMSGQARLKTRLVDSEKLIMKLNNMISELEIRLEKEKNVSLDFDSDLSVLRDELIERMKANENMFDSEMDAFRNNVGKIADRVVLIGSPPGQKEVARISRQTSDLGTRLSELEQKTNDISSRTVQDSDFDALNLKFQDLYAKTQANLEAMSAQEKSLEYREKKLTDRIEHHSSATDLKLEEDYKRLTKRLGESESMITNLDSLTSDLQLKLDSKSDVKLSLDKALSELREQVDGRLRNMDGMIGEFNAWKDAQKSRLSDMPKEDRKQIDTINKSIEDMSQHLKTNKDEMKKFKEYVISYMNNLVNTYEGKLKDTKNGST